MRENESVPIPTTLLTDGGEAIPFGVLLFPHVPQIGSHVLLHPPEQEPASDGDDPHTSDPEHVYQVVNVFYVFARPEGPGGERRCEGWQIDVTHLGSHLDVPRTP